MIENIVPGGDDGRLVVEVVLDDESAAGFEGTRNGLDNRRWVFNETEHPTRVRSINTSLCQLQLAHIADPGCDVVDGARPYLRAQVSDKSLRHIDGRHMAQA